MADRREAILEHLALIMAGIEGINKFARNKKDVSGGRGARPAIILMDADEHTDPRAFDRGRPAMTPNLVTMTPELYVMVSGDSSGDEDVVGPLLNALRVKVLRAVLSNSDLAGIVGSDGEIRYEGCVTDLARGRTIEGEMTVNFSFKYLLKPNDL